ncbi:hypothetical protein ACQP2X_44290 [Actinoplanes sp. CA-131856]
MADEGIEQRPSLSDVRKQYEEELYFQDDRASAEYAYALAVRLREIGLFSEARRFAGECLEIAERLPANTLDDVVSTKASVGGVPLPEHFHDGVVRSRLADLLGSA